MKTPSATTPSDSQTVPLRKPERIAAQPRARYLTSPMDFKVAETVSSWSFKRFEAKRPSVTRSHEWSYVFWRGDIEPELYHRPSDPGETRNVYRENRAAAREMHGRYVQFLREQETPAVNLLPRLWSFPMTQASPLTLIPAREA